MQHAFDGIRNDKLPGPAPLLLGALRREAGGGLVDTAGHREAAFAVAHAEALSHVTQGVDPAGLAGTVGQTKSSARCKPRWPSVVMRGACPVSPRAARVSRQLVQVASSRSSCG